MEPAQSETLEPEGNPYACPECGEVQAPRGKMAPALVVGLHKKAAHGIEGRPRNKTRNKRAQAEPEPILATSAPASSSPALTLLHGAGQDAKRGKGAPDADGLATALGRVYAYVGYFAWSMVVDRDPSVPPHLREQLVAELAPSGKEGIATVHPLARILAQTQLNRRYGAGLVDNLDVADALAAIGDQVTRGRNYLAQRRQLGGPPGAFAPGAGAPPSTSASGAPPNPMMGGYAGPTEGVVVDADMVAAMRQGGAAPAAPIPPAPGPEWAD